MSSNCLSRVLCLLAALTVASCSKPTTAIPSSKTGSAEDTAVLPEQLRGKHALTAMDNSGGRFAWEFTADGFKLTPDNGSLPVNAVEAMLGKLKPVNLIEGKWSLAGKDLILTNITADHKDGYKDVTLIVQRAPGLQVEMKGTKYAFRTLP